MRRLLVPVSLLFLVAGCGDSTSPGRDPVALRVTAPATAPAGQPFAVTIEAEAADGAVPVASVNGPVSLVVSEGTITPATASLVDGTVTLDVTLSVADGPVEITAATASLSGRATVTVGPPRLLPGDPARPAVENIPDLFFVPDPDDYTVPHPAFPGQAISHRVVSVALDPFASTGDVNDLLRDAGAVIAGGIPGIGGSHSGLLVLRLPFAGHAPMDSLLGVLEESPLVRAAVSDELAYPDRVPDETGNHGTWRWDPEPLGGNWGLELTRVPQLWNLQDGLDRRGWTAVPVGEVDTGVENHADLKANIARNLTPAVADTHGTHVAGIMIAVHGKGGIDGVSPFGTLVAAGIPKADLTDARVWFQIAKVAEAGARAINLSLGKRGLGPDLASDPAVISRYEAGAATFRAFHEGLKVQGEPVLLVSSAGNGSSRHEVPARFNSFRNYAALAEGWPHVIVVEAAGYLNGARFRAIFSNPGGHVSAPGVAILSTNVGNGYVSLQGTSMAAPFVTGLIANLWAVDGGLTHAQIRDLLRDNGVPVDATDGLAGSPMVDAFHTVMDIDRLRGNDDVLRLLLDIDDGTPDGNLRVDPVTGEEFVDTDADGNGGVGDGNVDMADFRRWRDLFLDARNRAGSLPGALDLDGRVDHPKRDLNGDGHVFPGDEEPYPLADFNGDGVLDPEQVEFVSGNIGEPVSDLELLAREFFDFIHDKEDLPNLVYSGDLTVDASLLMEDAGSLEVWSRVESEFGPVEAVLHNHTGAVAVYTLAVDDGPYTVTGYRRSAEGDTTCLSRETFDITLGGDEFWKPFCPGMDIDVTLADFVTPGVSTPLQIRAGIRQDDGTVAYKAGIRVFLSASGGTVGTATAETDGTGFVTTTAVLFPGEPELVVTVIADDPDTDAGAVATAVARPIVSGDGRVVMVSPNNPRWSVFAEANAGNVSDKQSEIVADQLAYGGSVSASANYVKDQDFANCMSSSSVTGSVSNEEGQPFVFQASGSVSSSSSATEDGCSINSACASGSVTMHGDVRFTVTDTMSYAFDATYEGYTPTTLPGRSLVLWDDTEVVKVRLEQGAGKSTGRLVPGRAYRIEFLVQISSHWVSNPEVQADASLTFLVF